MDRISQPQQNQNLIQLISINIKWKKIIMDQTQDIILLLNSIINIVICKLMDKLKVNSIWGIALFIQISKFNFFNFKILLFRNFNVTNGDNNKDNVEENSDESIKEEILETSGKEINIKNETQNRIKNTYQIRNENDYVTL